MKQSEETRIVRVIVAAQERLRQHICRTRAATAWHLEKAASLVKKPKLLERLLPHLEGDAAKRYLAELPGWIEQTKSQDARCDEFWSSRRPDYTTQRDFLFSILLRYDFALRIYEKYARELCAAPVATKGSSRKKAVHDETAMRMSADDLGDLHSRISSELEAVDRARAELVAGHDDLVEKMVEKCVAESDEPIDEITGYARTALAKAAESFDMRRGRRFATYAQWWIKTAIAEKKTWA